MRLFYSTTSPFARLVRIALAEKGVAYDGYLTDPWKDDPALKRANASVRVPTLVLENGIELTESLLIVFWLEAAYAGQSASLFGADPAGHLARAGVAVGGIEAAAAIIIGRKMTDAGFDETAVGLRRRRTIIDVLKRLEEASSTIAGRTPTIDAIAAVVLLDYVRFRFPTAEWVPDVPALDAFARSLSHRPSFLDTQPREMPVPA
ncbi:glutathione S-transferase family protein [Agrobacterium sp. MOPV5]|uniref:glutathione S-transferase family protein n=1 Tax=Agrobacterium leguminum TaxID=2792015 RepID=UPI0018C1E3A8|nr:glutathione S-transferase family protein [Agrobacterium leguminum]MBG0512095.1 glutathione S-transferase family protein [Agrobacterium leguminum]